MFQAGISAWSGGICPAGADISGYLPGAVIAEAVPSSTSHMHTSKMREKAMFVGSHLLILVLA